MMAAGAPHHRFVWLRRIVNWSRQHVRFPPPAEPKSLGRRGEDVAAAFLIRQGYKILERNRYLGKNEIDIIAQEGDTIAFVEVRTRSVRDEVLPEDSVGPTKQRQIRRAAQRYIGQYGNDDLYYRFDVVGVVLPDDGPPEITLYRNAFGG